MAYVLSSVSGNLISAASAGYAPTNSADVSAIASAYQVVSSTATQLYAGTAYVTSINEAPISAARAGNAANASLANSAWYDGTGRLISSLPDSAAVSAIASSYVESGVSSKQDTLSFAYNTADQISSINGSALGGMDEAAVSGIASAYAESAISSVSGNYYTTANESGFITGVDLTDYATTAYVGSAVSSKADSSALSSYVPYSSLEYNTASAISGINGSALAAGSTYSAGEGIDITDDVISVEAPVDIVAGPGIVIDNPDGNTLRVSVDQAIEVTLYEDSTGATSVTLSESYYNFERVRFTYLFVTNLLECTIPTQSNISSLWLGNTMYRAGDGNPLQIIGVPVSITNSGLTATTTTGRSWWYPGNAGGTFNALKLVKVVGIHRIANN